MAHELEPMADERVQLTECIQEEITERFSFTNYVLWRLYIDVIPAREIAVYLHKGDHTGVSLPAS